ncbi:MAG: fructosamine kinase family protein [Rhizobacter sp.]|nr:fructosamine kinase family protein [Rhizobacter sp.]
MTEPTARILSARLGGGWSLRPLGSSGFCAAWRAQRTGRSASIETLFVKSAPAARAAMLQAEADGLAALAAARCIRVPEMAGCWVDAALDRAVLALEWLDLAPQTLPEFGGHFGRHLAALHRSAPQDGDGRFGWRRDNWLGATPQRNRWSDEANGLQGWIAFYASQRLGAMAERLASAGATPALSVAVRRVIDALPGTLFDDGHVPRASLVHGDLWSGNWGRLAHDGAPVIFDPAVSVSDAEAELAMMELFGAPPAGFWPAYREAAGLADGYPRRRPLYQLYHLLNHALLFGGGYAGRAMGVIEGLVGRR